MRTFFLFMGAICFVVPAILLLVAENSDASPAVDMTPGYCTVFAKEAIPNRESGLFFFEVKISPRINEHGESESGYVSVGFATKQMALNESVGLSEGTYGYRDTGGITGLGVHQMFDYDDIVGCGVNLKNRKVFFMKNGEFIATTELSDNVTVDQLFPCVSMFNTGSKIEANFGLKDFLIH